MRSSELKIARDIKELLWMVIEMRKNVPKHISYGMLDRVQDTIDKMFNSISYANRFPQQRAHYLDLLLTYFCTLELYIEVLIERRLTQGTKQASRLMALVSEIGRQATGWRKSVQ